MKNWSIVTKLVASTSGIVCFLVLLGGYILIRFEVKMVDTFTQEILRGYHELINDREEMDEKTFLETEHQLQYPYSERHWCRLFVQPGPGGTQNNRCGPLYEL